MTHANDAVSRYLVTLRTRGLSPVTIEARRLDLRRIERTVDRPLARVTRAIVLEWVEARTAQLSPTAMGREMASLRGFLAWQIDNGQRQDDPMRGVTYPKLPRRAPRPISEDDLARAMNAAERHQDRRLRVILALASMAGLRAGEIAQLAWADVDLTARTIHVARGKGGHSRTVPIPTELSSILNSSPRSRGPVIPRGDGQAGHNTGNRVSKLAGRFLHDLGIEASLHCGRHRAGTVGYAATQDVFAVQQLLGHASPSTTAGYVRVADTSIRSAADALGQIGKLAS